MWRRSIIIPKLFSILQIKLEKEKRKWKGRKGLRHIYSRCVRKYPVNAQPLPAYHGWKRHANRTLEVDGTPFRGPPLILHQLTLLYTINAVINLSEWEDRLSKYAAEIHLSRKSGIYTVHEVHCHNSQISAIFLKNYDIFVKLYFLEIIAVLLKYCMKIKNK